MRILMILDGEFPYDDRVEKEAISLIKAGYKVVLLCYTTTKQASYENYISIDIHRFSINKIVRNKLFGLYLMIPFYRKLWEYQIKKILKIHKIDILHIHDLPLCNIGVKLKKQFGFKLVCDQHEYYSNWIVHTKTLNKFPGNVIKRFSNWKKFEKDYLSQSDLVITIEEPLRKIYIKKIGIDPNKIICVPNTPLKSIFNANNIKQEIVKKYQKHFVIFYAGGVDILRGIDILIESLLLIKSSIPNIKFVFAGKIYKGYNPLKHAEKLGVTDLVEYLGFLPIDEIPSYIASTNVCVFIPLANREEINRTIATKIYQYLVMKKPIIVSQAKLMQEFVISNKIGLVLDEYSIENFSEKVLEFYNSSALRDKCSKNAELILKSYYWEETSKVLIDMYNEIINNK